MNDQVETAKIIHFNQRKEGEIISG